MDKLSFIELFSGAGGFSASLDSLFSPITAIDNDSRAREVYTRNHTNVNFFQEDVTKIRDFRTIIKGTPDILLAGPPCQGFSFVGMKTKKKLSLLKDYNSTTDPKNRLPLEIPRATSKLRPSLIIMENVPAMKNQMISQDGNLLKVTDLLKEQLEEQGYFVSEPFILNSYDIGIAQRRKRTFVVASIETQINLNDINKIQRKAKEQCECKNLDQTILDLASIPASTRKNRIDPSFPDHVTRLPNDDDLKIIRNLRQGENYASLIDRMPEVLEGRKHKVYKTSSFKDKFYRLSWEQPSRTIVAHLQKDGNSFIHPSQNRSISVREAARIQTFPDYFSFNIPMSPAYRLVGNAVPPQMGKFLVEIFARMVGFLNEKNANNMEFAGLVT